MLRLRTLVVDSLVFIMLASFASPSQAATAQTQGSDDVGIEILSCQLIVVNAVPPGYDVNENCIPLPGARLNGGRDATEDSP